MCDLLCIGNWQHLLFSLMTSAEIGLLSPGQEQKNCPAPWRREDGGVGMCRSEMRAVLHTRHGAASWSDSGTLLGPPLLC